MGNCCDRNFHGTPNLSALSAVEAKAHTDIGKGLIHAAGSEKKTRKLLLLGAGSSGKSTLFKQLKCIHGWGFEDGDYMESRNNIRSNIMERLAMAISTIWSMDVIQKTFANRGRYAIPDNIDYFMKRVETIFGEEYQPNNDDVLKTRIRTSGLIETRYELRDIFFHIVDVGGQRNERRKWIHSFENVTAVLFVAALNHYNAVLIEDEEKNAMHESLNLFGEIMVSKWFRRMEMILFLNKKDLFEESIRDGVSMSVCFSGEKGWSGTQWDEEKYPPYVALQVVDDKDEEVNQNRYREYYDAALQFITNEYLSLNRGTPQKRVFVHVTDATNRDLIERV